MQPETFTVYYDRFAPAIRRYVFRLMAGRDGVEDVVQEVFLRSWIRGDVDTGSSSWLYTVARHLVFDVYRRSQIVQFESLTDVDVEVETDFAELLTFTIDLAATLSQIPERYRDLLLLKVRGFTDSEIVERTGFRASGLKMALCRARSMVKGVA
jgi:RNA polymerase sigma-70 factor (ECF subfamily)